MPGKILIFKNFKFNGCKHSKEQLTILSVVNMTGMDKPLLIRKTKNYCVLLVLNIFKLNTQLKTK